MGGAHDSPQNHPPRLFANRELTPHLIDAALRHAEQKGARGVVLHEMAIAGLPLLASRAVGATTAFASDYKNAYVFDQGKLDAALNAFMNLPEDVQKEMGRTSSDLTRIHSPQQWTMFCHKLIQP